MDLLCSLVLGYGSLLPHQTTTTLELSMMHVVGDHLRCSDMAVSSIGEASLDDVDNDTNDAASNVKMKGNNKDGKEEDAVDKQETVSKNRM